MSSSLTHTPIPTFEFRNPVTDEIIMRKKLQDMELDGTINTVWLSLAQSKDLCFLEVAWKERHMGD